MAYLPSRSIAPRLHRVINAMVMSAKPHTRSSDTIDVDNGFVVADEADVCLAVVVIGYDTRECEKEYCDADECRAYAVAAAEFSVNRLLG